MKKIVTLALAAIVALGGAACTSTTDGTTTATDTENTQVVNIITEYKTVAEAAAAAGFDVTVPQTANGLDITSIVVYESLENPIIEVTYGTDDSAVVIRKCASAEGVEDISGIYEDFASVTTADDVTLSGDGATVSLATWTSDGFSYSVYMTPGIAESDVVALVATIA